MFSSYSQRESMGERVLISLIGLVYIGLVTFVAYIAGYGYSQSDGFVARTGIDITYVTGEYRVVGIVSFIVMLAWYMVYFYIVAAKDGSVRRMARTGEDPLPFIYHLRPLIVSLAGVVTVLASVVAYYVKFAPIFEPDKPIVGETDTLFWLVLVVSIIQAIFGLAAFFMGLTAPAKGSR